MSKSDKPKEYVTTWNQAVGVDDRYWHTLSDFEDEREDYEEEHGDFILELECLTHDPPTWSAERLLMHLAEDLDDNYHNESGAWSDYLDKSKIKELEERLQPVINDFIAASSFVNYGLTGKWIKV